MISKELSCLSYFLELFYLKITRAFIVKLSIQVKYGDEPRSNIEGSF